MKLVIVESPSKAKTIQKYLGAGYKVLASGGHIADLPEKSLGIDCENNFQPTYVVSKDKKDLLKKLKQACKDSDYVYLATDPDREGEAISWHLATQLGLDEQSGNRIEFHEISSKAVNAAINTPRDINIRLVDAQQARRILDRLVGYKVSPILNKKIKSGLSGGRVQSAALKMIVDREREITAFKPDEYWLINAFLSKQNHKAIFKAALNDYNGKKVKVATKESCDNVLNELKGASWAVDTVKRGVSKSKPQAPFTTSTLQQDGSQKLNLTSPQVMQLAQQLYEGVDIVGEGHTALVTYIRTDSVRISPDMQAETAIFINDKFGKEFVPSKPNMYVSKSSGVQDAHEAIRPIALERTPDSLKDKLGRNQYRLYKLIYDRFIASQMTDAVYNTLNVRVQADTLEKENFGFKLGGKTLIFKGYTIAYDTQNSDEENNMDDPDSLPNLKDGEKLELKEIKTEQKFTKPPARFTDASLVKAMEENGIGRPSTYASVISVLAKREYTIKELRNIKPTTLGETVTEFMEKYFADIVNINFTADMENKLDTVENGVKWQEVISAFYPPFITTVKIAATEGVKVTMAEIVTDTKCDKCGAMMIVKDGKFGKFLACPNYPTCKNIKNYIESVGKCPACGGEISKRRTKTGKIFYGCSNYPTCKFMSWEIPAPYFCPECQSPMRIINKDDKTQYVCTKRSCNHTITLTTPEESKEEIKTNE